MHIRNILTFEETQRRYHVIALRFHIVLMTMCF